MGLHITSSAQLECVSAASRPTSDFGREPVLQSAELTEKPWWVRISVTVFASLLKLSKRPGQGSRSRRVCKNP